MKKLFLIALITINCFAMEPADAPNPSWLKIKGKLTPQKILTKWLCKAAKEGNANTVAQLLIQGANPNAKNRNGSTALCIAARFGHLKICTLLLDAGALQEPNSTGNDPLMCASAAGHVNICKLLLAHGANVHAKNEDNVTALAFAALNDRADAAELLLNAGSDIQNSGKFGYFIDIALDHRKSGKMQMVGRQAFEILMHTLIENGANLNARIGGRTLLHRAVHSLHEEACDLLLKSGATIASDDRDDSLNLMHALQFQAGNFGASERIYGKLIAAGLDADLIHKIPKYYLDPPQFYIGWQEPNIIEQFIFRPCYRQTNRSRTFIFNMLFCFKIVKPTLTKDIKILLLSWLQSHHLGILMIPRKCNGQAIPEMCVPATIHALYCSTIEQLEKTIRHYNQNRYGIRTRPQQFTLQKYDPYSFEIKHGATIRKNIEHRFAQPKLLCNGTCEAFFAL